MGSILAKNKLGKKYSRKHMTVDNILFFIYEGEQRDGRHNIPRGMGV